MTEREIKKSEFKRGCFPLLALIALGIVYLVFVNGGSEAPNPTSADQEEIVSESDEFDRPATPTEPSNAVTQDEPVIESSQPAEEPAPAATNEIEFISEPVVQPLPTNSESASGEPAKAE